MSAQLYTAHHTVLAAGTKVILVFVLTRCWPGWSRLCCRQQAGSTFRRGCDFTFTTAHLSVRTRPYHICQSLHLYCIDGDHTVLFVGDRSAGGSGGHRRGAFLTRLISPLLSVPHITIAVGFYFCCSQRLADTPPLAVGYRLGPATQSESCAG